MICQLARDQAGRVTGGTELSALFDVVMALAAWDSQFRRHELLSGNVYLASERDAAALIQVAGLGRPSGPVLEVALASLFGLELIYRFPVALKFRGVFGRERQLRLNCWGRRLVDRLVADPVLAERAGTINANLSRHLAEHDSEYRAHMRALGRPASATPGDAWLSARQLPVGVLC
jgi:hypothetical protein